MNVYVLFGESGDYSDRTEWCVRAYADEAVADAECKRLNEMARVPVEKSYSAAGWDTWYEAQEATRARLLPHDAQAEQGFGEIYYSVTEVPFVGVE